MFDSQYTDYKCTNTPAGRDLVREFVDAFRAEGIRIGFYYSLIDWHHPDFTIDVNHPRRDDPDAKQQNEGRDMHRYAEYMRNQVRELLTNYGEIPYLIIDGWNAPWGGPSYRELPFEEVDALVKRLQPNCLLMNIGCTEGISGTDVVFFENGAGHRLVAFLTSFFPVRPF